MFLEWKEDRLLIVPRQKKRVDGKGKDGKNNTTIVNVGKLILRPGVNYISEKAWNAVKVILEKQIKRDRIYAYRTLKDGKEIPMTVDMMDPAQIRRLAKETYDLESLREMLKQAVTDEARTILRNREAALEKEYKRAGRSTEEKETPEEKKTSVSKTNKATSAASSKVEME
jgi:hypothetical protein